MDLVSIAILSVVQGLTEFLPISSSGHLVLIPKLFNIQDPGLDVDAFLHLGTLLATIIYFRKEILLLIQGLFNKDSIYKKLAWGIALATLPVVVIGFSFKDFFESSFIRSSDFVAFTLVIGALLMYLADRFCKKTKSLEDLDHIEIFFIGLMQTLALFPGVSRSGATISAGLFTKLRREEAAKFSFILGLPAVTGAGILAVKDMLSSPDASANLDWMALGVGFIVSFIVGYLAIDFMIRFLKTNSLISFVIYRVALAALVYFLI